MISTPSKITLPFAYGAPPSYINTIPVASQSSTNPGCASYTDGFPALTMKAPNQGGLNPRGQDFNGILNAVSAVCRYYNAGGCYTYDSTFASDSNVGGYPLGATLLRADGAGFWFNEVAGNTTDPDSASASGWYPGPTVGVTTLTLSNTNVSLTYAQAGKDVIILSGILTANVSIILPPFVGMRWVVYNNTTGSFTVTIKTASGSGTTVPTGYSMDLYCDGNNNIQSAVTNVTTATKWATPRNVSLTGFVNGTATGVDGSGNVSISTTYGTGFSSSLGSNGYQRLPNGLIFQWGIVGGIATDQSVYVSFPTQFPNTVLNITTSHVQSASTGKAISTCSIQAGYNTSGFTLIQDTEGINAVNEMWFAIGY